MTGKDRDEKADLFAQKLKEVLGTEGIRIARLVKTVELRLRGLDEATSEAEVRARLAQVGGCGPDVFKVGPIKHAPRTMGTVWVRYPLALAQKILEAGKLQVRWVQASVEILKDRPLQCYKCMGRGHVQGQCTSEADRSRGCYNCGAEGHLARECKNTPKCMLCTEAGVSSAHRMGSFACAPPKKKRGAARDKGAGGLKQGGKTAPRVLPATQPPKEGKRKHEADEKGSSKSGEGGGPQKGQLTKTPGGPHNQYRLGNPAGRWREWRWSRRGPTNLVKS